MALERLQKYAEESDPNKVKAFGSDQLPPKTRELMLSFRRQNGSAEAFQYAYLYNARKNSDADEVVLTFSGHTVTISGENLGGLYEKVLGCGIQFVQEMKEDDQLEGEPFVETITVADRMEEEN